MNITFLGAAGEVTGAAFLVEADGLRCLVDCGMFQGGADADEKNAAPFAFDPRTLDCVVLSHAHVDHCGRLPLLVARGFAGPIYATPATCDLARLLLTDSAQIQTKDAEWSARRGGTASAPLYTVADVERCAARFTAFPYDEVFRPHPRLAVRFADAGHILGAAIVELWIDRGDAELKLVYSGDLGQPARPLMRDPATITTADALIVESTYGDRAHKSIEATREELVAVINATVRRGNVIVPAFAVGRTQELLTVLVEETRAGRLRDLMVFVDSPLAAEATRITARYQTLLDAEARRALFDPSSARLPIRIKFTADVEESKALNRWQAGAIIIASSGMCEGGRIRHHLMHHLEREGSAVLFTGYQAAGTLGRRLVDRASVVRIFGEDVRVRASIHTVGGLSAHADRNALLDWLDRFERAPANTFVVHGEAAAAASFAAGVRARFSWRVTCPERGATHPL